ncbi:MAG: chemotaxis protein CheX [Syntrophobacteraceae bacterium]
MTAEWESVLTDVISEVLETMFFSMVDFEGEKNGNQPFDYESEVQLFNHRGRYAILLRVSNDFARMMTANFLGIEEDQVKDEDVEDSLKEFANMVGGSYHAQINDIELRLGIPEVRRFVKNDEVLDGSYAAGVQFGSFGEPAGSAKITYLPDAP